jgi:hypothetical protein
MKVFQALALGAAGLILASGCFNWRHDVTLKGIAFEKARTEPDGFVIGWTKADTLIGNRWCRQGWVQLHPNGVVAAFTAAREIALPRFTIPAGTWVLQGADGVINVCAFPQDTPVQGQLCRGSGGPKGVQTALYPDGGLKQFFPRAPVHIDGIPCRANLFEAGIELHPNGRLKSAILAEDFARNRSTYRKGARIALGSDGQIQTLP